MLLGTYVFHSRVWAEEELEEQSLMVIANGGDGVSMLHGTPPNATQPIGMVAGLRKQLKGICMHEWIAQYNTTNNNIDHDTTNNNNNKPKEDNNTGTHLCMKLKVTNRTQLTTVI